MADSTELAIILRAVDQATATFKSVEKSAGSMNNAFADIAKSAAGFAVGMVAVQGAGKIFDGIKTAAVGFNSQLEQSTIAWKTFTGSTEAANAVMQQIQKVAASTPFEFEEVDRAAKRFVNMGLSAQQAIDFITPLSNAVASVGGGAAQVDQVSRAIAQIGAKGKVSAEEINQLAEAGINGWQVLAEAIGQPTGAIQKLAEQGKISSAQFNAAFTQFFGAGSKFAAAAQDQAKSLQGSLSTISDQAKFVGATAFKPLFDALSTLARNIAAFTQSDTFTVWGARVQAVVGIIVDALGGLAGAFSSSLGGVLSIVSTVGKSIYTALQWLNPFATHSPSLVSQVEDGVGLIESAYGRLGSASSAFDAVKTAFENLTVTTEKFTSAFGDDLPTKTENALAIMGPGARAAFDQTRVAMDDARASLEDLNSQWQVARDALSPLKDGLDAAKDALDDQKDALSGLKDRLDEAKDGYAESKEQLDSYKDAASQAERAIRDLGDAQLAGSGEFTKRIAESNIALKEQELTFSRLKQSGAYQQIAKDIDAAQDRIRALQGTEAKSTAAREEQRKAIQAQRDLIDQLKDKQEAMLLPAQRELDKRKDSLDAIRLERDATVGLAEDRVKAAAQAALGGKELTEQQVIDAIARAKEARDKALSQVSQAQPGVDAQEAAIKALEGQIREQEKAVADSQKTVDAASAAYDAQKKTVDALATSYREGKADLADFERQQKDLIATADLQIQKAKEQQKAAAAAAKAGAGGGPSTGRADVLAGLDISKAQKNLAEFQANVAQTRANVEKTFAPVSRTFTEVGKAWVGLTATLSNSSLASVFRSVGPAISTMSAGLQALVQAGTPIGDFLRNFAGNLALIGGALVVAVPLIGVLTAAFGLLAPAIALVLSPLGLAVVAIAALAAAWNQNLGDIQERAGELLSAFEPLSQIPKIVEQAFSGDVIGAIGSFLGVISDVRTKIVEVVAGWGGAFIDWIIPLIPDMVGRLSKVADSIVNWAIKAGTGFVNTIEKWGDALIGWIQPRIPAILNALEGLGRQIFDWVRSVVPKLIDAIGTWATSFVQWIIPLLPILVKNLEQIANRAIVWIREAAPALLGALAEWAEQFLKWIMPLIPPLLGALANLLGEIIRWAVEEALPEIAKTLFAWGKAFIEWIAPRVKPMLEELGKLLLALTGWIIEKTPDILAQLGEWGQAFLDWIKESVLPFLVDELDKIWKAMGPWIHDQLINLATALGEWAAAFVNWITDPGGALDALKVQLPKIIMAINDWILSTEQEVKANALQIGQWIASAVVDGVKDLGSSLGKALSDAWTAATKSFSANLTIPAPTLSIGGGGSSGAGGTGQRGPGTIPQMVGGVLTAAGMTADQIAAFCGPLAAEAISRGLGKGVDIPTLVQDAIRSGWTAAAGMGGFGNFRKLLDMLGIPTVVENVGQAMSDLAKGIPVAISTPLHYFLATGLTEAGKLIVGESGKVFRNGAAEMTLGAIDALGGGIQGFIVPAMQRGGEMAAQAFIDPLSGISEGLTTALAGLGEDGLAPVTNATTAISALLSGTSTGLTAVSESVAGLGGTFDATAQTVATTSAEAFSGMLVDAQSFAGFFGISIDTANKILLDHGEVAKSIFGDILPANVQISDEAVETFADKFGLNWDTARAILEAGGKAADAVFGVQIPKAAGLTTGAIDTARKSHEDLVPKVDDARKSVDDLVKKGFDEVPGSVKEAKNAATQISAVLLNLRDGLYGKGEFGKNGGLIQGVKDFIEQLNNIPRQVDINVVTHYSSTGSPGGGGGGSSGGGGGSSGGGGGGGGSVPAPPGGYTPGFGPNGPTHPGQSGPGGVWNNPSTGQPYAMGGLVTRPTLAMMGEHGAEAILPLSGTYAPRRSGGDQGWTGGTYEVKLAKDDIATLVDGIVKGITENVPTTIGVDDVVSGLSRYAKRNGGLRFTT